MGEMTSDQKSDGVSTLTPTKASWNAKVHNIFLDSCLEQINAGNKPGTHFTRVGWRNIEESFRNKAGVYYGKKQLKNHWNNTKEQWKIWTRLTGTSSMKWDPQARTFGASEEEWDTYTKIHPEAAQFQSREILFADKLNILFNGACTGETEQPTRHRKRKYRSSTPLPSVKEPISVQPESRIDHIYDGLESKSNATDQSSLGKLCYSIGECIECLDGMEEIEQGSDLYLFALDLFLKKEYREIFLGLKKASVRMSWLQRLQSYGPVQLTF